jgi:crossover junction endodeoxyribonuclease RusA
MRELEWFVEGDPKPQPRPRAAKVGGFVRVYDPGTAEGWKSAILVALKWKHGTPLSSDGPVKVTLTFYMQRPKSHYGTGKNADKFKPAAPVWHTQKPDVDNLAKAVMDALTGILWRDDSQVFHLELHKLWSDSKTGMQIVVTFP